MRTHRGERPYTCDACSRSFTTRSALVTHYRTHSGERPYPCPECGKSFTTSSYLLVHRRSHSDEKPFQCELCLKYFKTRQLVKKHQVSHTDRKFECGDCKKTFKQKKSYKLHSKIGCRVDKEFRWVQKFVVWVLKFPRQWNVFQHIIFAGTLIFCRTIRFTVYLKCSVCWLLFVRYCKVKGKVVTVCFFPKMTVVNYCIDGLHWKSLAELHYFGLKWSRANNLIWNNRLPSE
jgi:hypothetical protein